MRLLLIPFVALTLCGCGDSPEPAQPEPAAPADTPVTAKEMVGVWSLMHWNHEPAHKINIKAHHLEFREDGTFAFQSTGAKSLEGHFVRGEGEWFLKDGMVMFRSQSSYRESMVELRNNKTLIFTRDPVILKDRIQPGASAYMRAEKIPELPKPKNVPTDAAPPEKPAAP